MTGFFVTGTDTGVGKTHFSSCLLRELRGYGLNVVPFKPVASGVNSKGENDDINSLIDASAFTGSRHEICPYLFDEAIAPHIAAQRTDKPINLSVIQAAFERLASDFDSVVVEGVGGWRAPISSSEDIQSLARRFSLPVIVVVGIRLGCINHGLLTLDAVSDSTVPIVGWVANELDPVSTEFTENVEALRMRSIIPMLGKCGYGQNRIDWTPEFDLRKHLRI